MNFFEPNEADDVSVEIDNLEIENLVYKWKPTADL